MCSFIPYCSTIHAFFVEFMLLVLAAACVVVGIILLGLPKIPIIEGFKRTIAYVLFGIAIGLGCWFGGFREARSLDASADLRAQIEAHKEIDAERDRREAIFKSAIALSNQRADTIAGQKAALESRMKEMDDASHAHDGEPCLDAGGLQRIDSVR